MGSNNNTFVKNLLPPPTFSLGVDFKVNRFAPISDNAVEEMAKKKNAARTDQSTEFSAKVLKTFCDESGVKFPDSDVVTASELNKLLCKFYIAARNKKGELYKVNSMKSIRFSLQRYFLEKSKLDILNEKHFDESNTIFQNVLKNVKAAGKGETDHYPEIEPEDLAKLYSSFDVNDPAGLQNLVWFNIMFFLIRRGRENVRSMTKSTFAVYI